MADSRREDQREWYWNEVCMAPCDRRRPDCLESDRLADCMANMSHALRLEMDEAVPSIQSKRDHEEQKADDMHSSGEVRSVPRIHL